MERPWLILDRVLHALDAAAWAQEQQQAAAGDNAAAEEHEDPPQAPLEASVVNANTDAAAADAAHGAGAPAAFTISVAPPPLVSSVRAGPSSHHNPAAPDMFPYILAAGRFCLLVHFSVAPFYSAADFGVGGEDPVIPGHLVVVRHFRRRAGGRIASCAVRVPDRPRDPVGDIPVFLGNMNRVGLVCDHGTGNFRIAELYLATGDDEACLMCISSETGVWQTEFMDSPCFKVDHHRAWVSHGTLTINSTVLWFDLSWGIISCDLAQPYEQRSLNFHRLPRGRVLRDGNAPGLHSRRCIAVSENLVRYVEIMVPPANTEAATVNMWYRDVENDPDRWVTNYNEISFAGIWDDDTYVQTKLLRNPPMLVGVSPVDSNVVYFTLNDRIFGVNVPEHRVVDCQEYNPTGRPRPLDQQDEPATSRYLITWNLDADAAINVGHQQNEYPDHGDSSDGGALDEGEIDYQTPSE